jgi:hypothetical protein
LFAFIKGILLAANEKQPILAAINFFGYIAPAIIGFYYCSWRGFLIDRAFRRRYLQLKTIRSRISRLQEERARVKDILRIMLPLVCS